MCMCTYDVNNFDQTSANFRSDMIDINDVRLFSLNKHISQIYLEIFWLLCRKKTAAAMNVTVLCLTVICQIENDFVLTRT